MLAQSAGALIMAIRLIKVTVHSFQKSKFKSNDVKTHNSLYPSLTPCYTFKENCRYQIPIPIKSPYYDCGFKLLRLT